MSIIGSNILAGASGQGVGAGYTIETSLRLRSSASAYLSRTFGTPTDGKKWTYSVWLKKAKDTATMGHGSGHLITTAGGGAQGFLGFGWNNASDILFGYGGYGRRVSPALFRDPSAWYHILVSIDTTQGTESDRAKLYVNGVQQTWTTITAIGLNDTTQINQAVATNIGRQTGQPYESFDGYLTEINFIDGQALDPSSFGEYNADTGVWQPVKYTGTYGTNGFYLPFNDATTTTTLGADSSGNGNDWTTHNISLTAGATYDSMTDTPTPYLGGGNYAVLNPLNPLSSGTESDANLKTTLGVNGIAYPTIPFPKSGKWYAEITCVASTTYGIAVGMTSTPTSTLGTADSNFYGYYNANGNKYVATVASAYGSAWFGARTDVIGVAFDADTYELTMYLNGVSQGVLATLPSGREWFLTGQHWSGSGSHVENWNFGQRPFAYTPPTGFLPLHTGNLPDSNIVDGSDYFNTVLYTGDGNNGKSITGVGFQTDFNWTKSRSSGSYYHQLSDVVRGFTRYLYSNETNPEGTDASNHIQSVNSDGYVINSGASFNAIGVTYVSWNWKANGTGVTNDAGSITSTVSANQLAGFSIVSFTTNNTAGATVGHSLGAVPAVIIVKYRNLTGTNWVVYHKNMSATPQNNYLNLNTPAGIGTSIDPWNNTAPTSSVITLGSGVGSASSTNYGTYDSVAYCFAEVEGYSKFGSYTGNGLPDGTFVYLGFRPAFVLIKRTDSANWWNMYDAEREATNDGVNFNYLQAESSNAENNNGASLFPALDFLSNGFKLRYNGATQNASGGTYIYMAFAENPFKNSLAR